MDIVEEEGFVEERRKLLRLRAGLSDKDVRKAGSSWYGLSQSSWWFVDTQTVASWWLLALSQL